MSPLDAVDACILLRNIPIGNQCPHLFRNTETFGRGGEGSVVIIYDDNSFIGFLMIV